MLVASRGSTKEDAKPTAQQFFVQLAVGFDLERATRPFHGTHGLRRLLQAHHVLGKHDDHLVKEADAGTAAMLIEERIVGAHLLRQRLRRKRTQQSLSRLLHAQVRTRALIIIHNPA